MSRAQIVELDASNTCHLCTNALAKYSCPKCEVKYCSVSCYQSETHLQCSEEFYKNCIEEELVYEKNDDSKRRMLEILKRNNEEEDDEVSEVDSDDEDVDDLAERLKGVDLDNADQVWEHLTKDEQQEFVAFLKSEDVTKLIPSWTPWWGHVSKNVEELEASQEFKKHCPPIMRIKDFKDISKREPAGCVKYNLINVVAAYAFAARYFNGEHTDFSKEVVACVVTISQCLKSNENFEDFESAVKSVEFQCVESEWIVADSENFALLRQDLEQILAGPAPSERNFYVLCALSDLHGLLGTASRNKEEKSPFSKTFPNDHFPDVKTESRNKIKSCLRKVEYLLSFAKDFTL